MEIAIKYKPLLLEALEDMMYKISLQQEKLKGKPFDKQRKALDTKQNVVEELQHLISSSKG